jgi:hypothetical protein
MSVSRRRLPYVVMLLGASALATMSVLIPGQAKAQIHGQSQSSAPPFAAFLTATWGPWIQGCTGSLVANGWVLTAAHCVSSAKDGSQATPGNVHVWLGRTTVGSGTRYTADQVVRASTYVDGSGGDIALIRLHNFNSSSWQAVPLAFESSVVNQPGGVTFYSYGNTGYGKSSTTVAFPLRKSPDGAYVRDPACDNLPIAPLAATHFICFRPSSSANMITGVDTLTFGDSGSTALVWQSGAWQITGVADVITAPPLASQPARPVGATSVLAPGPVPFSTEGNWIRWVTQMPNVGSGTIVRDQVSGNSWLVQPDGYRNYIATAAVYNCLTAQGHVPINMAQIDIDTIPDRVGTAAACTPPPTYYSEQEGSHGANAFTDYHNASGMSPTPVPAAAWVLVTCKVYDPTIVSVNPDGYWYRIHSSPWNDIYYAAANTFMNGDPWGGPYTHNTDFAVPDC